MRRFASPLVLAAVLLVLPGAAGADPASAPAPERGEAGGPDHERAFFREWHEPEYGAVLPPDALARMWKDVRAVPSEPGGLRSVGPWTFLGPFGIDAGGGTNYSGRLLDIDDAAPSLRFASASGGLWEYFAFLPIALTESLSSQAIGSVATDPADPDHIFVGTGEARMRTGTGIWETHDGGANWDPAPLAVTPSAVYRIRYLPGQAGVILAATTAGIFRSTDNGATWGNSKLSGEATDLAIWAFDSDRVWTSLWGIGIFESTDGGNLWYPATGSGLPTSNVGRVALTAHPGLFPIVYASIARNDNDALLGLYRTIDGGFSWTDVTPPADYFQGAGYQGNYDNVIAVNPDDWQQVLVGGVSAWRTTDGGTSWSQISDPDVHADVHALLWQSGGDVFMGHDGGWCSSNDNGVTWDSSVDVLPTLQYYNIDVGVADHDVMGGGLQDNGIAATLDGSVWKQELAQDGWGFAVDAANPAQNLWATKGPTGGSWAFPRYRSTDRGSTWQQINGAIPPSTQWNTCIRTDKVSPVFLYANSGPEVFYSNDYGDQWVSLNPTPFPWSMNELAVSRWQPSNISIWAATASGNTHQLWVGDIATWTDRSAGLPNGRRIRRISVADADPARAYVLMAGLAAGQQVYRTTDRGASWTNLTGDLPAVPVGDVIEHPTDPQQLFLGTEAGCFRSTNGGSNWIRWNDGMPEANIVTDFATIDSLATSGRYYIVAGTFGRGLWMRDISTIDATGVEALRADLAALALAPGRPNPARHRSEIEFTLREAGTVDLSVYDVRGRRVRRLAAGPYSAGAHHVEVDVSGWASGVYFVHLQSGDRTRTRRLLVVH